jgi:hypothetical protein
LPAGFSPTDPASSSPQEGDGRRLVLWLGTAATHQLSAVDTLGIGDVALPLVAKERLQSVIDQVRNRGLGLFLDPEPWRNQLPLDHTARYLSYSEPEYLFEGELWDPRDELSREDLDELPSAWLSAQIAAGASELIIPGHIYHDATGEGRQNDLLLARRACELVEQRMLREGGPDGVTRRIYAQLNIWPFNLRNRDIAWLTSSYAELPVDGYWLNLVNFTQSETQYMGVRALVTQLQNQTGRRVIVAGLGRIWPGALLDGMPSVCFGHERSLFSFPPSEVPLDEEGGKNFRTYVYHPAVLGAIRMGEEGREAQRHLFHRLPCDCGAHPPPERPRSERSKLHHNAWWVARELEWATCSWEPAVVDTQSRIDLAARLRAEFGMSPLPRAWREIVRSEQAGLRQVSLSI